MTFEHKGQVKPHISLRQQIMEETTDHVLWSIRAKAVQSYADLEQSLCRLFALVSNTDMKVASVIFFKIVNTGARLGILEKLFKMHFEANFNLFRNSLIEQLRPIDTMRNQIVHWNMVPEGDFLEDGSWQYRLSLKPPTYWTNYDDITMLTRADIEEFFHKCRVYSKIVGMFDAIRRNNEGPISKDELDAWNDIFQKPIVYPPPADTLLYRIWTAR